MWKILGVLQCVELKQEKKKKKKINLRNLFGLLRNENKMRWRKFLVLQ